MLRSIGLLLAALLAASASLAADLTALERRWLQGMQPVIEFARDARMPLDIVVQPQPAPDASPLAMGFVAGRCKLVLSMRGHPQAQAILERIEPDLVGAALELMAAHELGHCRRHLDGAWQALPAGFSASAPEELGPSLREAWLSMRAVRREEGHADLVGLAWVRQRHGQRHYARLLDWLAAERTRDRIPGSHHDTLAWIRLAGDGQALARGSIFAAADALWGLGLAADD